MPKSMDKTTHKSEYEQMIVNLTKQRDEAVKEVRRLGEENNRVEEFSASTEQQLIDQRGREAGLVSDNLNLERENGALLSTILILSKRITGGL